MEGLDVKQIVQFIAWDRVPYALVVLGFGWLLLVLSGRALDDLSERFTEWRLALLKFKAFTRFLLYALIAVIVASSVLDVQNEALLAVLGTIGLAVGFAFKDLLASLMAGVILLIDEPFQLGDRITFGGYYGEVTSIGLRSVRVQTLDDNSVTIPNSSFLTDVVANANTGNLDCMVVMEFYVSPAEDVDEARRIVEEATATSRYVFLDKPLVSHVRDVFLSERFVTTITVKAYVFDARYEKSFGTDVTVRVKRAFRQAGIRTPDTSYRDTDAWEGRETPPEEPA
jgi:small-conductance mechanosensitive channel